ncbi:hypothetical protein F4861DRAFT_527244 [Xylaria intraflava]|nr:hypothetical protein F4861DRAFT_527244 [Xylaria intraflava]
MMGDLYYICASSSGQSEGENVHVLATGSATDAFVATLNDAQRIILSNRPNTTADFDSSDETIQWVQQVFPGATGSLTVDGSGNIESFELRLTQPWPLTFSSTSKILLQTFGPPSGEATYRIPPPGIDASGLMLTLGLQTANVPSITVRDVFVTAEASGMIDYIPSELLSLAVDLSDSEEGDPKRNALWYIPTFSKRITMRLQFKAQVFDSLQDILNSALKGLSISNANFILSKDILLADTELGPMPILQGSVAIGVDCSVKGDSSSDTEVQTTAGIEFRESSISLTFMFESKDVLKGILQWVASQIGDDTLESLIDGLLNKEENGKSLFPDFNLRRMRVQIDTSDPNQKTLSALSIDIEVSANLGGGSTSNPVVFLISYTWNKILGGFGELTGQLWNNFDTSGTDDLLPHSESWKILHPITQSPAASIDLTSLIPGQTVDSIPETVPSQITQAYISLSQDSFSIRCAASAILPPPSSAPQPYLGQVAIEGSFAWGKSSSFTLNVFVNAGIQPSEDEEDQLPALISGSLSYDSSTKEWVFNAALTGLHGSTLAEFFDEDSKSDVGPLLNSIEFRNISVQYKYTGASNGKASGTEFTINGDLLIAGLSLSLDFHYTKDGFTFSAALNPEDASATIGDILASIFGSDIELPDFVYNTLLSANGQDAFRIDLVKGSATSAAAGSLFFLAQLNIANIHIAFTQLHRSSWGAKTPSKRVVKFSLNGFSGVKLDLPLIGSLTQPLDELYFLWVQDPQQSTVPGKGSGLTRSDLLDLNTVLPQDQILVLDKIKPDQQKATDLLLATGCHFGVIIISNTGVRSCLVDYEFMKPSASGSKSTRAAEVDDGSPSAQAPYKKMAGPLSISNVGLKYKDKLLYVMFDATFQLGPLGFSLLGFSLGFSFAPLDENKLPIVTPTILGLAASYDQPPLSIAGAMKHGNDGGLDYYAGGLVVGWQPYQFEAAGFYGTATVAGGSGFTSVFIFAKLNGPLATIGFAEIQSLCGGFGYNSSVRLPTVDEVYQFPFVASSNLSGTDNSLEVLQKLVDPSAGNWFSPLDKTYWLAVGLGVGAFQMLAIDAVVVVQFGSAIKLGIFAVATADVPSPASSFKLAHVELGIAAVADFDYGTLKIDAQLSPRSYILDPNCHLTGGFGLYSWFDAPHADKSLVGQFVFTLGGYHQAFLVPVGYPNPPRLGITWNLGGGLTVSGQAYFAVTPKACMAGGRLHAALSAGPLSAWFDAFADFLINYKPFYFNLQGGISVGIGFSIDIWFIHIRISVEIGAQLYLWGPPIAGRVHVDFWIVGFDINFGKDTSRNEAVTLQEFYELVLQSQVSASLSAVKSGNVPLAQQIDDGLVDTRALPQKNEAHNFLAQSGLLNPTDQPERNQNEPWVVRAGSFSFVVECKMAINAVKKNDDSDPILTYDDVYGKPMKLTSPLKSVVTVKIDQEGAATQDEEWRYDRYLSGLPRALWAKYDPAQDPRTSGNNIRDLLNTDQGVATLMGGVLITAPPPTLAPDPFPAYEVADADLQRLLSEKPFPTIATADDAWAPAPPLADNDPAEQYDAVHNAWANPSLGTGDQGSQGFVQVLASSLKWKIVDELKSIANIPARLNETFNDLYVAAPLLTK